MSSTLSTALMAHQDEYPSGAEAPVLCGVIVSLVNHISMEHNPQVSEVDTVYGLCFLIMLKKENYDGFYLMELGALAETIGLNITRDRIRIAVGRLVRNDLLCPQSGSRAFYALAEFLHPTLDTFRKAMSDISGNGQ
jgi:hypothetical protein